MAPGSQFEYNYSQRRVTVVRLWTGWACWMVGGLRFDWVIIFR